MRARVLLLLSACAGRPGATTTTPLALPQAEAAVAVSSARFLGLDPSPLSNAELRNCRFGRTDKLDLVPVLLEWTPSALRFAGKPLLSLSDGALPDDLTALSEALSAIAEASTTLAGSGCHPWRGGPDDLSAVPALLIAADAASSGAGLARLSQLAAEAGLIHQAVWVGAEQPAPIREQPAPAAGVTILQAREVDTVADVLAGTGQARAGGSACVQLSTSTGQPGGTSGAAGAAAPQSLRGELAVVPLFWPAAGAERLVTGERCPAPAALLPPTLLPQ
jgi:hypothetical protein